MTDLAAEGNPVDRVVYTGLLVIGLCVLLTRTERISKSFRNNWPVLMFLAYCLLSLLWSDFPDVGFKRWTKVVGDFVMVLIIWTDPQPSAAFRRILARTAYVLIPLSILFNKYYPNLGRIFGRYSGVTMYTGVALDKNGLGAICLLFGLAAVWRILTLFGDERHITDRKRRLWAQYALLVMIVYLFWLINSMTSLSCFIISTVVMFAIRTRLFQRNRSLIHYLIFISVAIPLSVEFLGVSSSALQAIGRDPTLTDRTNIWAEVIKLVPNRLLGAGYGSFWVGPRLDKMLADVTHYWIPNQAHNGYLEIYANLGWLGVALLAVVIVWGYKRIVRAVQHGVPLSDLMLAYFYSGIVYNFTEAAFFRMLYSIWVFFLIAITLPNIKEATKDNTANGQRFSVHEELYAPVR